MKTTPLAVLLALVACSTPRASLAGERAARSGPFALEVVDEGGRSLPTFQHRGRTYVLGTHGDRYLLRLRNQTPRRVEAVASVDGRDVIDGRPASAGKRGYLIEPWGEVLIDGFRLSGEAVAAFRFSTVDRSYAARMGDARDVGVIGAAIFAEAAPPPPPPPLRRAPEPFPEDRRSGGDEAGGAASSAPAPAAKSADGLARSEQRERPGLGTGFGERHESPVVEVPFERASSRPEALLSLRYDDRPGLLALGIDVDGARVSTRDRWLRESAEPFRGDRFAEPPPGWR